MMVESKPLHHVFLPHNCPDKGAVEPLAVMLREKGLSPFLNKWNLVPGVPIEDALIEAPENSDSAVIIVGPGGEGPRQSGEMRDILRRAVKSQHWTKPRTLSNRQRLTHTPQSSYKKGYMT